MEGYSLPNGPSGRRQNRHAAFQASALNYAEAPAFWARLFALTWSVLFVALCGSLYLLLPEQTPATSLHTPVGVVSNFETPSQLDNNLIIRGTITYFERS